MLELEIVVRGVERVDADVAVLAPGRVSRPLGVEGQGVDGPEVSLDPAELLLEDGVEEPRVELPDARGSGRHVHRLLTAAQNDLWERKNERLGE